jgi:uncharacterized protein (TIGR03437 family)
MFRKHWIPAITSLIAMATTMAVTMVMTTVSVHAATLGTVVQIGGEASDIALDPTRGLLYIANFTANRIDVMTLSNNTIQTSINVPNQPSSISVSPDAHWLLVANYGANTTGSATNALTLIDLTNSYAKQTFTLSNSPLTVAFGFDNKALVVTTQEFIIFDPITGTTNLLLTIPQVTTLAIPQAPATFPSNFTQATAAVSADGLTIAGMGGTGSQILEYRFKPGTTALSAVIYTAAPPPGPSTVSLSSDGSLATFFWGVQNANFQTVAQFSNPSGIFNLGSTLIDSSRNLIYAQIPPAGTATTGAYTVPAILNVVSADNLTLQDSIQLPENLTGKSLLSADNSTMYSISDSGVTVLPVGSLASYPRLTASVEDLLFLGNFCVRTALTQTFTISDPGGNHTPFTITPSASGITVSPSSGVTPANITVSVDPNAFAASKGTVTASLNISSSVAVDLPPAVRVLINSQDPSQRGTIVDVPGKVVDLLADPQRNVYYVLRQDKNQVLVYNGSNNTLTATLRTCTTPKGMAITFDQTELLVGCDNAQIISVFDLDLLTAKPPISVPNGYVQSIASSANATLVHARWVGSSATPFGIGQVDLAAGTVTILPSLGVYKNSLPLDTVLASSSNGGSILVASSTGSVMLYDANSGTFTVSRQDFPSLSGAYAVSNFNQFVVGNNFLDASLVPKGQIGPGSSSGFSFVNQTGYFVSLPSLTSTSDPGTIEQVNLATGSSIQPVAMVEDPMIPATTVVTSSAGTTTTTCTGTTTSTTSTQTCSTTPNTTSTTVPSGFTRSLAPLPSQTSLIVLSTSGFTVLPWTYAASVAPPVINAIVSAADNKSAAAPGGLISLYGANLSATNMATSEIPVPTALANSCITVNGQPIPLIFVSQTQVNAQMPFQAVGAETVVVHTPGGTSNNFNLIVQPNAPAVFLSGVAGPENNLPTVIRVANQLLATDSNPIHQSDTLVIYATGLGQSNPSGVTGYPAPSNPPSSALTLPTVTLGGMNLPVLFAGLAPGEVGVNQINVSVPANAPVGLSLPLTIHQGTATMTVSMRVIP